MIKVRILSDKLHTTGIRVGFKDRIYIYGQGINHFVGLITSRVMFFPMTVQITTPFKRTLIFKS